MEIYDGILFVGKGDSPDDRECIWTPGHVDQEEFSATVKEGTTVTIGAVRHVWADNDDPSDESEGPAFWDVKRTDDCPHPITMAFVE